MFTHFVHRSLVYDELKVGEMHWDLFSEC